MKVYVVTWEYPTSEDGFVAGVIGVAMTPKDARDLAEAEAREYLALKDDPKGKTYNVQIQTEEGELARYPSGEVDSSDDWDMWIEWDSWEVQGA